MSHIRLTPMQHINFIHKYGLRAWWVNYRQGRQNARDRAAGRWPT